MDNEPFRVGRGELAGIELCGGELMYAILAERNRGIGGRRCRRCGSDLAFAGPCTRSARRLDSDPPAVRGLSRPVPSGSNHTICALSEKISRALAIQQAVSRDKPCRDHQRRQPAAEDRKDSGHRLKHPQTVNCRDWEQLAIDLINGEISPRSFQLLSCWLSSRTSTRKIAEARMALPVESSIHSSAA
jgi:hypothetical protein